MRRCPWYSIKNTGASWTGSICSGARALVIPLISAPLVQACTLIDRDFKMWPFPCLRSIEPLFCYFAFPSAFRAFLNHDNHPVSYTIQHLIRPSRASGALAKVLECLRAGSLFFELFLPFGECKHGLFFAAREGAQVHIGSPRMVSITKPFSDATGKLSMQLCNY
jgi:hypothetical protein